VEIKGQLDAKEWFLLQNLLSAQHVRAPLRPSSGAQELYRWLLPVVPGALVYRSLVWCGAVGYASGLRDVRATISFAIKTILLHPVGLLFPHVLTVITLNEYLPATTITMYLDGPYGK
jgi:hypothetical protein